MYEQRGCLGMSCSFWAAHIFNLLALTLHFISMFTTGWARNGRHEDGLFRHCFCAGPGVPQLCRYFSWDEMPDYWATTRNLAIAAAGCYLLTFFFLLFGSCGPCRRTNPLKGVALLFAIGSLALTLAGVCIWWVEEGYHGAYSLVLGVIAAGLQVVTCCLITAAMCVRQDWVVSTGQRRSKTSTLASTAF